MEVRNGSLGLGQREDRFALGRVSVDEDEDDDEGSSQEGMGMPSSS